MDGLEYEWTLSKRWCLKAKPTCSEEPPFGPESAFLVSMPTCEVIAKAGQQSESKKLREQRISKC